MALAASVLALSPALFATAFAQTPPAPEPVAPTPRKPVVVDREPFPLKSLRHWQLVFAKQAGDRGRWRAVRYRVAATAYLIESRWVEYEARDMGIAVTREETRELQRNLRKQLYPNSADYRRFVRRTGLTASDLTRGARIDLLSRRIGDKVTGGTTDQAERQRLLFEYRAARQGRWRPRTLCHRRWVVEEWCAAAAG